MSSGVTDYYFFLGNPSNHLKNNEPTYHFLSNRLQRNIWNSWSLMIHRDMRYIWWETLRREPFHYYAIALRQIFYYKTARYLFFASVVLNEGLFYYYVFHRSLRRSWGNKLVNAYAAIEKFTDLINKFGPVENGWTFANNILKCVFCEEIYRIISQITFHGI